MSGLTKTALVLANIGAINWGLAALDWNVIEKLGPTFSNIVYTIIALCGIFGLVKVFKE